MLIAHDLRLVRQICDRVAVLERIPYDGASFVRAPLREIAERHWAAV